MNALDENLMVTGQRLWAQSFAKTNDLADAVKRCIAAASLEGYVGDGSAMGTRQWDGDVSLCMFAAAWAHSGYPKMVTTHTYAAAMMSTQVHKENYEDIIVPWRAFLVAVPNGLLMMDGVDYDRILINTLDYADDGPGCRMLQLSSTQDAPVVAGGDRTVADMFFREKGNEFVGLLWTMQHTNNFRASSSPPAKRNREARADPRHRIAFVGRPLSVDCRPSVRSYLCGEREGGPASVQSLVRGHYKRQVIGIGRAGRRVIWVEPYWRGPEDAPILARPYAIGASQ